MDRGDEGCISIGYASLLTFEETLMVVTVMMVMMNIIVVEGVRSNRP